uniref:Envelopment polyprotein n=1 Tax=Brazoran virus TaxID=1368616 RepID=S5WLZ1_9VIRU
MSFIIFLLSWALSPALTIPIDNRCFDDGLLIEEMVKPYGISEVCVKDDISLIKTISKQHDNGTYYSNIIMRKMVIQNYEECNPVEVANGPIMIFRPNTDLMLIPHTYACRAECTISLDKDDASIILHSEKLNHYEVMGTTTATRWFQGSTTYSLEHTCEHIQVTCGNRVLTFHSCFKHHMACVRLLNKSYMPAFMINSICQNKELIIMTVVVLIIFSLLYILTFTYISYLLLPIFMPATYVYAKIYDRLCKKCAYCGLAYHPFTKCGENCVCGARFENSERMKKHRESKMCKGYKYMRSARLLCKNKGSNFCLAIVLAFLLLSFIQPIEGVQLTYNGTTLELESLSQELDNMIALINLGRLYPIIASIVLGTFLLFIIIFKAISNKIEDKYLHSFLYYCTECDMTHPKRGLHFYLGGEFTNKCNSCMCGVIYPQEDINNDPDYCIPITHQINVGCYAPARYHTRRSMYNLTHYIYIVVLIILVCISSSIADDTAKCIKPAEFREVADPLTCSVWAKAKSCSAADIQSAITRDSLPAREISIFEKMNHPLNKMLELTEKSTGLLQAYLIEDVASKLHCNEIRDIDQETGKYNKLFKELLTEANLEICAQKKETKLCDCFTGGSTCKPDDTADHTVGFYTSNEVAYRSDVKKIMKSLIKTFPGIAAKEALLAMNATSFTGIKNFTERIKTFFSGAKAIKAALTLLCKAVADGTLEAKQLQPDKVLTRSLVPFNPEWKTKSVFDQIQEASPVKECITPHIIRCTFPMSLRFQLFVSCKSEGHKFYYIPDTGYAVKYDAQNLCVADAFCDVDFQPVPTSEKTKLQALSCLRINFDKSKMQNSISQVKCQKIALHICSYKSQNTTFMECKNGFFYEVDNDIFQSAKDEIGTYCFSKNCKAMRYPHHKSNLQECRLHGKRMQLKSLRRVSYDDIEQYKHSLEEAIKTDLVEHKYTLTENLPYTMPTFIPVSIQGVETDAGVENSYIESDVIVQTGSATGFKIKTKNGDNLFDIIVFVKSAHYEAVMDEIYQTGPTIGMNVQHNEKCTGSCPENRVPPGWLSFKRERTSQWGCEEFGCMAINEGCVWGKCQDIIKPDMTILRKATTENPAIEICIVLPSSTYCHSISSFNSVITQKIEMQFISNESGKVPKLVGYKSHKVFTGMINDYGSFSKMCGSVQMMNKSINGAGNPRFDYVCHSASRKEVIMSRCFDNFYDSCLQLKPEHDLIYDTQSRKISLLNKLMGEIKLKIKLGDIAYKVFEKKPQFDLKGSCVGCINCIEGIDCQLDIAADIDALCPIVSNCQFYHSNIQILISTNKYGLKAKCSSETINIDICGNKAEIQISIIQPHDTIQVGNSDQTYFVKENDLRCGTWLCKVKDQGISALLSPLYSIFGNYANIAFYVILGVVVFFLIFYFMIPVFGRIRDALKKNELEYTMENLIPIQHIRNKQGQRRPLLKEKQYIK